MIDLKKIQDEIDALNKALQEKQNEYKAAKESNLKEQYGADFGCENCAYSCCVDVGDFCTYCTKHECIYCNKYCDEYKPENELSKYIRDNHYYDENTLDALNGLFDVIDIMRCPELHQKALKILKLRDAKGNKQ